MDYENSVQYIKECTKHGIKLGLDRIKEILKRLGNPQERFQTIHIAGTNGKGSTTAMFDSVLREAGYQIGRFTSPHLISYRERFMVADEPIAKDELATIVTAIQPVLESVTKDEFGNPTEFEVGTVIAFEFFARRQIEIALIEVGMGGRFDATNVIQPILSIITRIALDHQEYLGDTIEKIAYEKAGIIKPSIPLVIGAQEPAVEKYLLQIAAERKAPFRLASDLQIKQLKLDQNGTAFVIPNSYFGEIQVKLGLIGEHQAQNCLNVMAGLELLIDSGILIDKSQLLTGLAKTTWPGRLERVDLVAPLKLFLDGAHNLNGVKALVESMKVMFPGERVDLLVGILNNRPLREMGAILAEIAGRVIVTNVPDPKSAAIEELKTVFQEFGLQVFPEPSPEKALKLLLATENSVAVATGSLYLIGYLRSLLLGIED